MDNPRTKEHYLLRDSLLPSLLAVLGRNTKNEYPQRVFEAGGNWRLVPAYPQRVGEPAAVDSSSESNQANQ